MTDLRFRFHSWRYRLRGQLALKLLFALPDSVKDRITVHRMGELTSTKASLQCCEVPGVTVQQLLEAMKEPNAAL